MTGFPPGVLLYSLFNDLDLNLGSTIINVTPVLQYYFQSYFYSFYTFPVIMLMVNIYLIVFNIKTVLKMSSNFDNRLIISRHLPKLLYIQYIPSIMEDAK